MHLQFNKACGNKFSHAAGKPSDNSKTAAAARELPPLATHTLYKPGGFASKQATTTTKTTEKHPNMGAN